MKLKQSWSRRPGVAAVHLWRAITQLRHSLAFVDHPWVPFIHGHHRGLVAGLVILILILCHILIYFDDDLYYFVRLRLSRK